MGRRLLIGVGGEVGGGPGGHTPCGRLQGLPVPRGGLATLWPPSGSASWYRVAPGKIITLAFVPSNFENISLLTFLEPKTTENWQLTLWQLVNRLVPENM